MTPEPHVRSSRPRRAGARLYVVLVLALGTTLTGVSAYWLRVAEQRDIREEFARRSHVRHQFLRESFRAYENILFSLRLVVVNSERLSPAEFARAANELRDKVPGIKALQWAPVVEPEQAPGLLAYAREHISPAFAFRERSPDGVVREVADDAPPAAGRRAVITYCHPVEGNERVFGYDIFTAHTLPDLRRALASRQLTVTRSFRTIQGFEAVNLTWFTDNDPADGLPPEAGPGFVQAVIELQPMLDRLWQLSPASNLDFALFDVTGPTPIPLYDRIDDVGQLTPSITPAEFATDHTRAESLDIGGRKWMAYYRPSLAWVQAQHGTDVSMLLGGGLLFTVLVAAYLNQTWRKTAAIQEQVDLRTRELRDHQTLLDDVINHSPMTIWVKNADHRYQLVNEEFSRLHRIPREQVLGATDGILFPPVVVAKMQALDQETIRTGRAVYFEDSYEMHGETRVFYVAKFPIRHADGSIYAVGGIANDITERRRAETDRQAMERRLLETQRLESLGVLAGGIAHDFNNLLTGILGHASLLQLTITGQPAVTTSLAQIEQAARRAADLCRQMLAYAGRGQVVVGPVLLDALVREVVPLLKLSATRRARLHFRFEPGLPPVVADESQLSQIVMNLVMNAAESLDENAGGDITISTRLVQAGPALFARCVHQPELPPGPYVQLEVADAGCGMDEATLARIFDPFFTTKFAGRGLGLAAVLGIVRTHRGALRVDSRLGVGTTFAIYLPVAPASASAPGAPAAPARRERDPAAAPRHILLADDEVAVREIAMPLLRLMGWSVDAAPDGDQALALLKAAPARYEAALIDLTMPGLTGLPLLDELRRHQPRLAVLFISGFTEQDAAALLARPRTAFLAKPFTLETLRASLDALLDA